MTDHDDPTTPENTGLEGLSYDPEADELAPTLTGPQVLRLRKKAKLSRAEFAQLCGFTGSTPSRLTTIETKEKWRRDDRALVARALLSLEREGKITIKEPDPKSESITLDDLNLSLPLWTDPPEPPVQNGYGPVHDLVIPDGIETTWSEDFAVAYSPAEPVVAPVSVDREGSPALEPIPSNGVRISNGMLNTWNRCRRKWWLTWYRGLAPIKDDHYGIRASGIRIHRALAAYYVPEGQTPTDPREALSRVLTEDWTRIVGEIRESVSTDSFESVQSELWSKFTDVSTLERAMVEGYVEWLAESGEDQSIKIIASETPRSAIVGTINNGTTPVQAVALIDARAIRTTDGARVFLDHKSTGDFPRLERSLRQDPQMLMYHLVEWLSTEAGEARCDGALYNMIRRVKRSGTAKPPFYKRVSQPHSETELETFKTRLLGASQDMYNATAALDQGADPLAIVYPAPTKDCHWECDFYHLCSMFDDGSRAEDHLDAFFTKTNPWSRYDNLDPSMDTEQQEVST